MSYHILHQFDEQWISDNRHDKSSREPFRDALDELHLLAERSSRFKLTQGRLWLIVIASMLVAGCALYFAVDASRNAHGLQQRVLVLEATLKK